MNFFINFHYFIILKKYIGYCSIIYNDLESLYVLENSVCINELSLT